MIWSPSNLKLGCCLTPKISPVVLCEMSFNVYLVPLVVGSPLLPNVFALSTPFSPFSSISYFLFVFCILSFVSCISCFVFCVLYLVFCWPLLSNVFAVSTPYFFQVGEDFPVGIQCIRKKYEDFQIPSVIIFAKTILCLIKVETSLG